MSPAEQRRHMVSFRVTSAELARIYERAASAGQINANEFARAAALNQPVPLRQDNVPVANAHAVSELNRLGVNLNQITRQLNAGRAGRIGDIYALVARINETLDTLLDHDHQMPGRRPRKQL